MENRKTVIAAGLGCRSGCSTADVIAAIRQALTQNGVDVSELRALYSADFKAAEASLRHAAQELDRPLILLARAALAAQAPQALSASAAVAARFELPSVAETAALAGAFELGERRAPARLLAPRSVAGAAVCALARVEVES
jgi:cobalt-precorrin 5A hydrolase